MRVVQKAYSYTENIQEKPPGKRFVKDIFIPQAENLRDKLLTVTSSALLMRSAPAAPVHKKG